ncbi:MAG: cyclic peptide export ABC transporter [Acidimicrobiales bacterium]
MRIVAFVLRNDRGPLLLATVASLAAGFASAGLMGFIGGQFVRQDLIGPLEVVGFLALMVFSLAAGLTARWILVRLVGRRTLGLQMELARRLVATDLPTIEKTGTARLFAVLTDDARAVSDAMMRIPDLIISSALIVGSFAYLSWLSPVAVSVLFAVAIPVILLYRRFHGRVLRLLKRFFSLRDERYQQYQALTEGAKELQVNGKLRERFLNRDMTDKGEEFRHSQESVIMAHEVANSWSQTAYFIFVFALLVLIRGEVVESDILGAYALIALYVRSAMMQLTAVIPVWTQANEALGRIESIGLADDPNPSGEVPATPGLDPAADSGSDSPRHETATENQDVVIVGKDLTFTYPAGEGAYNFELGPVDFELRSGELIFITGGNGSGKTTLMKLLCALYEPTGGTLTYNGEAVSSLDDRNAYRDQLSVLFADSYLFEELIGLSDTSQAGTELANQLLAELDLTEKVSVDRGQLSTAKLSTGERRRLALLGAFVSDKPVYAFDEWAANQDPVFKRVFYRTLLPELRRRGKLVVVISHDDGFFDGADRVLHLTDGKLVSTSV